MSSSAASSTLTADVPRKLAPLLYPRRYKGAYGGRGGSKSHFFAEEVILRCYERATRVVCIREVQQSLRESVRQLLVDKIVKFGLEYAFEPLEAEIRGRPGTPAEGSLIIFKGMQSYNAANIKSLENYDIAWCEEAQTLSQHSLDLLRPTLRKEGSELWFSWNPRFKTDPVDQFFRKGTRENAIAVEVNWRDNPWFMQTELHQDMLDDYAEDEDKAEHIWGGAYGNLQGAVLGKWVSKARREGRINDTVAFDPLGAPVEISTDIGFRDTATWWFWQRKIGGFSVFDCMGDSGLDADDWAPLIEERLGKHGIKPTKIKKIWMPPDAQAKTFQSKHSSLDRFAKHFGWKVMGDKVGSKKSDQISAARLIINSTEFHKTNCEAGLDALEAWEFEYDEETQIFSREPKHNWASHWGDGFAYGCEVMQGLGKDSQPEPERHLEVGSGNLMRMSDLDKLRPPNTRRI